MTIAQTYLHALADLEMETRMGLVPDSWEDLRGMPLVEADEPTIAGGDTLSLGEDQRGVTGPR